jgi:VCBS repeat-containing protein
VPAAGVLTNDTDVEGSSLTAVLVTGPAHGTLVLNPNGSFTYTPTSAYSGSDTFTYRASDGTTTGNIATVTITDTIKPTAVDVQATNGSGGTISRLDQNDTIVYTFSEPMDPNSIVAGWDGTDRRDVVVRVNDGDLLLGIGAPTPSRSTTRRTPRHCRWERSTWAAPTTPTHCSGDCSGPTSATGPPGLHRR